MIAIQIKPLITLRQPEDFSFRDILVKRKIPDVFLDDFLFPKNTEYPWEYLKNLDWATDKLYNHLKKQSHILVILDTDTDGITSGTIIYRYLTDLGANVDWFIGSGKIHGITQHYSPDLSQYDLIIACDSLSNEYETYTKFLKLDLEIILLDHHGAEPFSDLRVITVNSENFDYPNPTLSGAGVAYKFCQAFDDKFGFNYAEKYTDLAACGIIADVSDLTSLENRSICYRGLAHLHNLGLKQILNGYRFDSQACAFSIATIINACNRLDENELAANILLSDDEKEIKSLYKKALGVKARQDEIYQSELKQFHIQNSDGSLEHDKFVYFITSQPPLTGYIAQKLAEITHKPAIVLTKYDDKYSGSIRSYGLRNFRDICITDYSLAQGHPEAAGIKVNDLGKFISVLDEKMSNIFLRNTEDIIVDIACDPDIIDTKIAKDTEKFNLLCGKNFPHLTFYFADIIPETITTMKDKHTKFTYHGITFLLWNDTLLYDQIQTATSPLVSVTGTLSVNKFRGKEEINFIIDTYEITDFNPFI